MSAGLLDVAEIVTAFVSFGPGEIPVKVTVTVAASSSMKTSAGAVKRGASFTGATVRRKVPVVLPWSMSVTRTVMVAEPKRFGAGVITRVRLAPVPSGTILAAGISTGSEEDAEN